VIELDNVSYAYEKKLVLRRVNFRVDRGQCAFISGDNGTGKSTLIRLVNGLYFPCAGRYLFENTEITAERMKDKRFAKAFHQKIGYVWQNPEAQLFCASVEEEIAFGPRQMGLNEAETTRRVNDALELLGLLSLRHRAPYTLSGGEKKKTAIAAVLAMNPTVWTLDEPLNALDKHSRAWLAEFLSELKKAGKTVVFSSHDREAAEKLADIELNLNEGHE